LGYDDDDDNGGSHDVMKWELVMFDVQFNFLFDCCCSKSRNEDLSSSNTPSVNRKEKWANRTHPVVAIADIQML